MWLSETPVLYSFRYIFFVINSSADDEGSVAKGPQIGIKQTGSKLARNEILKNRIPHQTFIEYLMIQVRKGPAIVGISLPLNAQTGVVL